MPHRKSSASAKSTPNPLKRIFSPEPDSLDVPLSRQSKRLRSSPLVATSTPRKSPYFEHPTSESEDGGSSDAPEDSGYEDEDASLGEDASEDDAIDEDDYESSDAGNKKRRRNGLNGVKKIAMNGNSKVLSDSAGVKGKELWRPGVKVDMEAGKAVYIALPKARVPGKIAYMPAAIHPNTLLFLKDLRQNNDREWLKMHDADYRQSKTDWDTFVDSLTEKFADHIDDTIPELPHKDLTFRIYRDVRFSPDQTPYKIYFSAAWSRTGRKGPYACYYLQIQPGNSFIGAGIWQPDAAPLALMRAAIDRKSEKLKSVLTDERLRKSILGINKPDQEACIRKFVELNKSNMLKTKPRDYAADHPEIRLLRLRNFVVSKKISDDEILGKGGLDKVVDLFSATAPWVIYLNSIIMPDVDPSENEDSSGGDEDVSVEDDEDPGNEDEDEEDEEPQ